MSYADKTLNCRDCGTPFVFTAGEQEFYAQKGFTNEPTRCQPCRQQRKSQMNGRGNDNGGGYRERPMSGGSREQFTTTCAGCGKSHRAICTAQQQARILRRLLPRSAPR
jgi:RNase P subunit RPR2